jgi:hypothetical protein
MTNNPSARKQIAAIKAGIESLDVTRRRYSSGHYAYRQGIRKNQIKDGEISGTVFDWVEKDYKEFEKITDQMAALYDLIEVIEDGADPVYISQIEKQVPLPMAEACVWVLDDNPDVAVWETSCKESFIFMDGTPADNNVKFCPFCGQSVKIENTPSEDQDD